MRNFIYSLMTDKKNSPIFVPIKWLLYAASLLYGLAIIVRGMLYEWGVFKSGKLPMKVISVGNITLGGTGKTPFVIMLAGLIKSEIKRDACILIRGYGWDEQAMLKKNLPDNPILVGEDRARSGRRAIRLYGSDTAILDDGFQHWELARDMDIVLIDSRNPFGNGHLFPRGILRETKYSIKRADVAVLTKTDEARSGVDALKNELKKINSGLIFVEARHRSAYFYSAKLNKVFEPAFIKGRRVILLSSIGDPSYFEDTMRSLGADIADHIIFPDHHDYRKKDMEDVAKLCDEKAFEFIVTTEKDMVKLNRLGLHAGSYHTLILAIELEIISGKEELSDRLHSLYIRKAP